MVAALDPPIRKLPHVPLPGDFVQLTHMLPINPVSRITPRSSPIMENQMEKKMENEMEAAIIYRAIWGIWYIYIYNSNNHNKL